MDLEQDQAQERRFRYLRGVAICLIIGLLVTGMYQGLRDLANLRDSMADNNTMFRYHYRIYHDSNGNICTDITGFSRLPKTLLCPYGTEEIYRDIVGTTETRHCCDPKQTGFKNEALNCRLTPCQPSTFRTLCSLLGDRFINDGSVELEYEEVRRKPCNLTDGVDGVSAECCRKQLSFGNLLITFP